MTPVTVRAERWAAGGDAIARDADGRVVFVNGALPGENVTVELTSEKRDWARGVVVDVLEASPDRVLPPCPSRRAGCGGCGWQHLAPAAQQRARVDIVADALRRTGGVSEAVVEHGAGVDPVGYRTTLRVAATVDGRAGFRAAASHDIVAAPECLVAHPALRGLLASLDLDAGVEPTLRVSGATGELAADWDRRSGDVRGLPAGVAVGRDAVVHEVVAGRRLRVSMGSFFQSGPQAAAVLVDAVARAAPELTAARLVVDAYAGTGLLGACAVPHGARVVAVETSRTGVADARRNLADRDALVMRGEVGAWRPSADDGPVDVVLADPARSGLGRPGVAALTRAGAPVLVVVSCDPASLGRDARLLVEAGYHHIRSEVVDTFPHTTHVEAVTRFVRA